MIPTLNLGCGCRFTASLDHLDGVIATYYQVMIEAITFISEPLHLLIEHQASNFYALPPWCIRGRVRIRKSSVRCSYSHALLP